MKRFGLMVIMLALLVSMALPVLANDAPVLSAWAKDEAVAAEKAGILPQDYLYGDLRGAGNRGQAVGYLVKLAETVLQKELPNNAAGAFPDLENTYPVIVENAEKAYSAGIVTGYEDGSFGKRNEITREEYAVMLYRMFRYLEQESSMKLLPDEAQTRPFADENEISAWALAAVRALVYIGILGGDNYGAFRPADGVSLEQMIVLSYRCWLRCRLVCAEGSEDA